MPALIQRNGTGFVREGFKLSASEEAFRILSDGLYSDKVTAVIRELGTNAVDAHIESGNQSPFDVHLPTNDEPFFRIRDYGTGLCHEDMMDLYSTYFGSSKRDNNELTGQLGLGSKSPLAYTRSFSVISYHGGYKRHYIVALNEDGIPELNYLENQTTKSDEHPGLEIQFAVKLFDIAEFNRKAPIVYNFFKLKPTLNTGALFPEKKYEVFGDGWHFGNIHNRPLAVMGGVAYPIDANKITGIKKEHIRFLAYNPQIEFPIGSISFTPSREHLSYNRNTITVLMERFDTIIKNMAVVVDREIAGCKTIYEARQILASIHYSNNKDNLSVFSRIVGTNNVSYNGVIIDKFIFKDMNKFNVISLFSNGKTVSKRKESDDIVVGRNVEIYEKDMARSNYSRCKEYIDSTGKRLYLVEFTTPEERKAFLTYMEMEDHELKKTSSLPPVIRKIGQHRISSIGDTYVLNKYRSNTKTGSWDEKDIDFDAGGVYVKISRFTPIGKDGSTIDLDDFRPFIRAVESVIPGFQLIGVRPHVVEHFKDSDEWVDLWTYMSDYLNQENVKNGILTKVSMAVQYDELERNERIFWRSLYESNHALTNQSVLELANTCQEYSKLISMVKLPEYKTVFKFLQTQIFPENNKLRNRIDTLYQKFILLYEYIDNKCNATFSMPPHIIDYFNKLA